MGNAGLRALVTGGPGWCDTAVVALEGRGFAVEVEHCTGRWGPAQLPGGPFQCYVQLPWTSEGLASRLELLAAVASRLGPRPSVLLAFAEADTGNGGPSADLLEALAQVVLDECGRPEARVVALPADEFAALPGAPRTGRLIPAG